MLYHNFSPESGSIVENLNSLITAFETFEKKLLSPEFIPKIVIKLDSSASPGLQVSSQLLDGLLECLYGRGFTKGSIELLCLQPEKLGLVPGYAEIGNFSRYGGHLVRSPMDEDFFETQWFHDSPMPPKVHDRAKFFIRYPRNLKKRMEEERKSYLPGVLLDENFFWISLSVLMDDPVLGISGASTNMSLEMISNARRFKDDPTLGAAAVTEILAIPEIWNKRVLSILDLSRFQYAGGDEFNAEFIAGSSILLLGRSPFAVDSVAWNFLAKARRENGLKSRSKENALIFQYSESLNLGSIMSPEVIRIP